MQIFFYGATGLANACSTPGAASSPRRGARSCRTSSSSPRCCRCPSAGDEQWTLDDVLDDDRLRWTLGLGATAGIAAMAMVLLPAPCTRAGLRFRPPSTPPPGGARLARAVGLDARLRRRQPGRDHRDPQPGDPGSGDADGLLRGVHVLRAPPRAAGRLDRHDVPARVGERRRAGRPGGVLRPDVARHPADRAAHAAGRRAAVRAAPADRRRAAPARQVHGRRRRSTPRGRSAGSPSGSSASRSTCSCCAGSTRTRTRARRSSSTSARTCSTSCWPSLLVGRWGVLGLGLRVRSSYLIAAVWALQVLSYKVPGFPLRDVLGSLWRDGRSPRWWPARSSWLVARRVGGNAGLGRRGAAWSSASSSASWCTSASCGCCGRRSSTAVRADSPAGPSATAAD